MVDYPELFGLQASLPIARVDHIKLTQIVAKLRNDYDLWVYKGPRFVIIDLPSQLEGDGRRVYHIPQEIRDPDLPLMIKAAEGLFGPQQQDAVVICGANGTALKPFWTFDSPNQVRVPGNVHALFSTLETVVTVRAGQEQLLVVRHEVRVLPDDKLGSAWILSAVIHEGSLTDLLHHYHQYELAAKAALHKSRLVEPFEVCFISP